MSALSQQGMRAGGGSLQPPVVVPGCAQAGDRVHQEAGERAALLKTGECVSSQDAPPGLWAPYPCATRCPDDCCFDEHHRHNHAPGRRASVKCCGELLSLESRKGVVGLQLDEELVQDKIGAVQRYRSMFVFATQPQHPPSASDMIVELMCTKAKYGLRD